MTGYYQGRFRDQWEAVAAEVFADELALTTVTPRTGLRAARGAGSAARIAARLGAATGLELTADLVRRLDKVHALGAYLRTHARLDLCVQLLPDSRGPRPKLFYVHSASGNAFAIWALRSLLPVPLSGVRAAGLYGEREIPRTIAEFADVYLDEIRDAQPEGPYLLCGFSGGGSIAFELARRLHAQGAQVGLLALIDAPPRCSDPPRCRTRAS
ncbi:thioesterase domain-containing protein [Nonomuraea thailandensis]